MGPWLPVCQDSFLARLGPTLEPKLGNLRVCARLSASAEVAIETSNWICKESGDTLVVEHLGMGVVDKFDLSP